MPPLHIIMVDDDHDDCFILTHVIKEVLPDSQLTCFHNCATLVKYLETLNPAQDGCTTPDLILMDLNMPGITGQDCLKKIRGNNLFGNIPIIIYSTASRSDIIDVCYKLGATSYIVKPSDPRQLKEVLLAVVEKFVSKDSKRE